MKNDSDVARIAESIARTAHAGQTDKLGVDYIEHPARVAQRVQQYDASPEATAAAWLHDVVEDTEYTPAELSAAGIPDVVVDAVMLLSKTPGQTLEEYCAGVRESSLALAVKRADIEDNTDPARTAGLPDATRERLAEKYRRTTALLGLS